MAMMDVDGSSL